jgi:hypothetical protein
VRRKLLGAAMLTAAMLVLGACGGQAGTDGSLINQWQALPEAKISTPATGACYSVSGDPASLTKWPEPVNCGASHTVETISVGTFTGEDSDRTSPPPSGGPGRRRAYESCANQAKTYLGDDWRAGRLDLLLSTPISLHWDAGARWFRCDVVEYKDLDSYEIASRTSSVKGALTNDRPVALGCVSVATEGTGTDLVIKTMTPTACTTAHNGEFAGIYEEPDGAWPSDAQSAKNARFDGCRPVVATFAGIPNDADFKSRVGQIVTPFTKADWEMGNRGVRCWIFTSSKTYTNSLKGVGVAGLPINYK